MRNQILAEVFNLIGSSFVRTMQPWTFLKLVALTTVAVALADSAADPERCVPRIEDAAPLILPGEGQRISQGCPGGEVPTPAFRVDARPLGEALTREHLTPPGVELKESKFGKVLVFVGGRPKSQLPTWLPRVGIARPVSSQVSSQVLFCTWLE